MTVTLIVLGSLAALLCLAWLWQKHGERSDARRFPPPGRMVDLGTHRLHVLLKGPRHGPTIVIEQGAGAASLFWWHVVDRIAGFAGVCAYDRAGLGASDPVERARTPAESAAELSAMLTRAAIPGPYILVAHSYGGLIVRLFARDHKRDVAGMVLVDTIEEGVHFQEDVLQLYRKFAPFLAAMRLGARFGVQRLIQKFSREDPKIPAELRGRIAALSCTPAMYRGMATDVQSLDRYDAAMRHSGATGSLGDLPLIVVSHGQPFPGGFAVMEKYWRDGQDRLAALSTNSELIVAKDSNHMIQLDEPDVVVAAIRKVYDAAVGGGRIRTGDKSPAAATS
jgi:pimeloyl-ACP methyl ester carboxylesterase